MEKPYLLYSTARGALTGLVGMVVGASCGSLVAVPFVDAHRRIACASFIMITALCLVPSFWLDQRSRRGTKRP